MRSVAEIGCNNSMDRGRVCQRIPHQQESGTRKVRATGRKEASMYKKLRTLRTIDESGAVLIVRLENAELAERVAEAAIEGGFRALEITLSIPGAVDVIRRLAAKHGPSGVAIGAGTVLDEHAAYEC